ncbi:hypothetical protein HDV57DRAFT_235560 [Trichoderma longibrachiatum]|uniref:Bys1 family protein n=1 Tax=Trichoderma longibrachiatum ATCC 18648 TaxID=983965 RepID=A0A2T4CEC2_TRILO|nr:hypothetical protein M440DRAFT_1105575 [Trichoderma longibrachiatum ATCC 18648]
MKFTTAAVLAIAALVESASALGKARVVNKCPFSVTLWSVGSAVSAPTTLAQGGSYGETFSRDPVTGGRAIKVTVQPDGLYTGKPQTIFATNLDGNTIWYDLSDVFGDAFNGHKVVVASANAACPQIVWTSGVPPAGSQVKNCGADKDVTLTLCA